VDRPGKLHSQLAWHCPRISSPPKGQDYGLTPAFFSPAFFFKRSRLWFDPCFDLLSFLQDYGLTPAFFRIFWNGIHLRRWLAMRPFRPGEVSAGMHGFLCSERAETSGGFFQFFRATNSFVAVSNLFLIDFS
jgi:hypothetical protein